MTFAGTNTSNQKSSQKGGAESDNESADREKKKKEIPEDADIEFVISAWNKNKLKSYVGMFAV